METDLREELFGLKHQIECAVRQIEENKELSEHNKELILKFKDFMVNRQTSLLRVKKYLLLIRHLAIRGKKDLDTYTRADVDRLMADLRLYGNYKPSSLNDYITTLRMYFRCQNNLSDDEKSEICKHLKKAKTSSPITREMILTEVEVNKLIGAAKNIIDKCVISIMYDCALRPSSLRGLKLKDVVRNTHGYRLLIDGKTGRGVSFAVISEPLITQVLNTYPEPYKNNPESPFLYQMIGGKLCFMSHSRLQLMIKRVSKAALGRSIHPYILRHSRATALTIRGVQDSILKKFMHHSPTGRALATYQKLIESDLENMVNEQSGVNLVIHDNRKDFILKSCPKCGKQASLHELVCANPMCSGVFDVDGITKQEIETTHIDKDTIDRLLALARVVDNSPEILQMFQDKAFQEKQVEMLRKEKKKESKVFVEGRIKKLSKKM